MSVLGDEVVMDDCMSYEDFIIWLNQHPADADQYEQLPSLPDRREFLLRHNVCDAAINELLFPTKKVSKEKVRKRVLKRIIC
jgi:hypothetical protein